MDKYLIYNHGKYFITISPHIDARTLSVNCSLSGYKLACATFIQNNDLYYISVTDNIYIALSITNIDEIQIIGMNKTLNTSVERTISFITLHLKIRN